MIIYDRSRTSYLCAKQKRAPSSEPWVVYELCKATWLANNPGCTPAEYQDAIRRISQEVGV